MKGPCKPLVGYAMLLIALWSCGGGSGSIGATGGTTAGSTSGGSTGGTTGTIPSGSGTIVVQRGQYIYLLNADGSNATNITDYGGEIDPNYAEPRFSPDGSKIIFVRTTGKNHIWTMNPDGSGRNQLTISDVYAENYPVYGPTGSHVYFATNRWDPVWGPAVMNADGTNMVPLLDPELAFSDLDCSPDGSKLVMTCSNGVSSNVYIMNVDGTGLTSLTSDMDEAANPAFSRDGTRIVFQGIENGENDQEVYAMNLDGSNRTRLTTNDEFDGDPVYTLDDLRILFVSGSSRRLYSMAIDGTGVIPIDEIAVGYQDPAIWP